MLFAQIGVRLYFLIFFFVKQNRNKPNDILSLNSNGPASRVFYQTHGLVTSRDWETGKTSKCVIFASGDTARGGKGHGKAPLDLRN